MSAKRKLEQYGVLIVGLLIGGGFAFGGIASYAGMVGGSTPSGGSQQFNATLPADNYRPSSFGFDTREMRVLAIQNDVVFVTVLYDSPEQRDSLDSQLQGLTSNFDGRLYIQLVNASDTMLFNSYGLTQFPQAVVISGTQQGVGLVSDVNRQRVSQAACQSFRQWSGGMSAYCTG